MERVVLAAFAAFVVFWIGCWTPSILRSMRRSRERKIGDVAEERMQDRWSDVSDRFDKLRRKIYETDKQVAELRESREELEERLVQMIEDRFSDEVIEASMKRAFEKAAKAGQRV